MKPFVSVIFPFYNVEKYIEKSIESILNQTFTDFELIIVNDGSTDNSINLIQKFLNDKRCKLLEKENGGLSDARNYGIERAQGMYLTFIDSDDYVSKTYLQNLVNCIITTETQIAVSSVNVVYENSIDNTTYDETSDRFLIMNSNEAIKNILYQKKIDTSAWGKLYDASLFSDVKFPYGLLYEDLATIYKLLSRVGKISYVNTRDYNYLIRRGSITQSSDLKKKFVAFEILSNMEYELNNVFHMAICWRKVRIALDLLKTASFSNKSKTDLNYLRKIIKKYFFMCLFDKNISIKNKLKMILARINISLYINISATFGK